jgi:uncharacterized membrane protein
MPIHRTDRKAFFIAAGVSAGASVALLVLKPLPPVGFVVAIELAVVSVIWLYRAFFAQSSRANTAENGVGDEGEGRSQSPARWVP